MAFRITLRRGSAVERSCASTLEAALDEIEAAARDAARTERRAPVDLRVCAYEPGDQVVTRVEIRCEGIRAGVDVHGDGALTAHTGRVRRAPIEARGDEDALAALRRTLRDRAG